MKYSNDEILALVQSIHKNKEDFYDGDLIDRINKYSYYIIEEVNLSDLDEDVFNTEADIVQEYIEKDTPIPPIVLDNNKIIIDGAHRVKAAKKKKLTRIMAYVGVP